jgi:hypothetical protein
MTTAFEESSAQPRTQQVPYAHLSVELDHLYMEDLVDEASDLHQRFARVRPWYDAILASAASAVPGAKPPRVSTCILIDDYFSPLTSPAEVVPRLREAAAAAGLRIDYLARESSCAEQGGVSPADLAVARVVPVPALETDGSRPPTLETGWLSNGRRSPEQSRRSMRSARDWGAPEEADARKHSIFVDVELWSGNQQSGDRLWSCAMLAAVWQLMRLGLLRDQGRSLAAPQAFDPRAGFPDSWAALPPLLRLEERANPFTAYRTISILEHRFMPTEQAVRVILSQIQPDAEALAALMKRAENEGLRAVDGVLGRIGYVFLPDRES